MKLLYTPEAVTDLRRLREFIAEKNPEAAQKMGPQLVDDISTLITLPYLGRKVQRAPNPEIVRDLSAGAYIVRYLLLDDAIHVLRIWHKREDWANVL
ncbi:MAG: plasmid stabilization protein [Gammaproteobacteria bacterium]|nr:plasmid stabilization protein [Gammaproteobacteria bacterium]|tara:strand:- start:560 stop:850 length:291 start_codon:yes stop_codon:yes gene_type:complete